MIQIIDEADKRYLRLLFKNYKKNKSQIFEFIENLLDTHQEELQEIIEKEAKRRAELFVPIESFRFGDKE